MIKMERLLDMSKVISVYLKMRDQYLSNAQECIGKKELRKASELLWGAVTQAIKALASTFGVSITTHNQFFEYTKEIGKETEDKEYYTLFVELNALHKNFYDELIPPESFPMFYEKALLFLKKIDNLQRQYSSP